MAKLTFDVTPERSLLMSKIKAKNTKPELALRKALWAAGVRYRIHSKLPGTPDIAIKKYRLVIFIDGEFWHGKDWEKKKEKIVKNRDYWIKKIERNIKKDIQVNIELKKMGFTIFRFWSREIEKNLGVCVMVVLNYIYSKIHCYDDSNS